MDFDPIGLKSLDGTIVNISKNVAFVQNVFKMYLFYCISSNWIVFMVDFVV